MPLIPEESARLAELEAVFEAAGGRGVEVADELDALRRLRDLPFRPEDVRRRLVAEFPVYTAVNARIGLWSLLHAAVLVRAQHAEAAFILVDADRGHRGLLALAVLDEEGSPLDEAAALVDDDDLGDALSSLDTSNRGSWGAFVIEGWSGQARLDLERILAAVTPSHVFGAHPPVWPLAENEEVLEVGFSYGLTGTKDWGAGAWHFAVDASVADAEAALRAAVAEYLATPGSNPNRYPFNWGDAADEVPDEVWARHGLRPLDIPAARSVDVDHDETFWDPDEEAV